MSVKEREYYQVECECYTYNDGPANNGYFDGGVRGSLNKVKKIAKDILNFDNLGSNRQDDLLDMFGFGSCGGFFKGKPRIFKYKTRYEEIKEEVKIK